ncbi:hypothetical protein K8I28_02790 [bacterium]|nr:hypothetical protein [bacterium]
MDWTIGDQFRATYAIKVLQPADKIFSWLSQMGRGAGYYCDPLIFNQGRRSATYLLDDLPPASVDDKNEQLGTLVDICENESLSWILENVTPCGMTFRIRRTFLIQAFGLDHCRIIARTTMDWDKSIGWLFLIPISYMEALESKRRLQSLKSAIENYEDADIAQKTNRHMAGRHQFDMPHFAQKKSSND